MLYFLKNKLFSNKVAKNASWIILCRIAQSVLSLIIGMITARYLGPSNYGLISYASSIVIFFAPIMQLGITNILVNEIIRNPKKEGEILGSSLILTLISSVCCIVGIACFSFVANPGEIQTVIVCVLYSIVLLFQSIEIVQYWFQAKYLSKYISISMLCAYLIVALYKIYLLITQKDIYWFAISSAFDVFLIDISLLIIYKKMGGQKFSFSKEAAKRLFSSGKYYIVSSLMVTIFSQTDRIMIKAMVDTESVAFYSVAVTAASLTSFVFCAIIDSMRPLILESKREKNDRIFELNLSRLYCIIIYLALFQSVFMTLFSKYIVNFLYGSEYNPAILTLRIIVWYTTFAYIGGIRDIWILAEGKQKYLWKINLFGAITNVALNLILIPILAINGAAIASLITQFFTNVIMGYIIRPISNNNKILIKSLNPRILIDMIRQQ